ncbi:MAG: SDR family oxidoreductase [Bacteroidales bacterium]|nr:SDR family oxidoreductase [Bacteroidales bacterium]MDD3665854.1 SDR family oxidoreductase [Bacteroidales bacterium]
MTKIFSLTGKTALVTGAGGLLGKAHCKALADAGATVVAADLAIESAEHSIDFDKERHLALALDVTSPVSVAEALKQVTDRFGRVDILVNNAAVNDMVEDPKASAELSKFENYPLELWNRSLQVNLTGVFLCSQAFGSWMAANGGGSIINIASTYGITAPDQSLYTNEAGEQTFHKPPAYSVTKGGVLMFTRYLAAYWGNQKVRVNALSPGGVLNGQSDFFVAQYAKRTPLGRMAHRDDYMGAIVFLASDSSAYMTGANLVVDGGWTIW